MSTIYHDTSYKKIGRNGNCAYHDCWRAEVDIDGQRLRFRSKDVKECQEWLEKVTGKPLALHLRRRNSQPGKINPRSHKYRLNQKDIARVVPLADFPDYVLDPDYGDVWRHPQPHVWYKMHLFQDKHGAALYYLLNKRRVTLARLLYAVRHNISYYDIPRYGFALYYDGDGKVTVKTSSEVALERYERQREETHATREKNLKHTIEGLQSLLMAYQGDTLPLLKYLLNNRHRLILSVSHKKGCRYNTGEKAFNLAFDSLLRNLDNTFSDIKNLDGWLINTACRELTAETIQNHKKVDIERVRSLSGNKYIDAQAI